MLRYIIWTWFVRKSGTRDEKGAWAAIRQMYQKPMQMSWIKLMPKNRMILLHKSSKEMLPVSG